MNTERRARKTAQPADEVKISVNDVFRRLDEKFDKFDARFNDQAKEALAAREEMRTEIRTLGDKIDAQIRTFDNQLNRLNTNMETVMKSISDHEFRITQLEQRKRDEEHDRETWTKVRQHAAQAGKVLLYGLFLLGAAYGIKPLVKVFNFISS